MSGFGSISRKSFEVTSPTTVYGELNTSELTPIAQGDFVYNINPLLWSTQSVGTGASVTSANGIVTCSSGQSSLGFSTVTLLRGIKYHPGQGIIGKMTAIFSTGTDPGSAGLVGIGNVQSSYTFTKLGSTFNILWISNADVELRKLTITNAGSTGNATITLNGSSFNVAVTTNGTTNHTAYQISRGDYSGIAPGWQAESVDGAVYFLARRPIAGMTGVYGISSATNISGTFERITAGSNSTATFISQSAWNGDKLDGTGPSMMTLDPTKGNVYQIGYQYLGFGNAVFQVFNPDTTLPITCHTIKHLNSENKVILRNPTMTVFWAAASLGGTTNVDVMGASAAGFVQGPVVESLSPTQTANGSKTGLGATEVPLVSIRCDYTFGNSEPAFGTITLSTITAACVSSSGNTPVLFNIYKNVELTGPVNYARKGTTTSIASTDTAATGIGSNGTIVYSFVSPSGVATNENILSLKLFCRFGEWFTITAAKQGSGTSPDVYVSVNWVEDQ